MKPEDSFTIPKLTYNQYRLLPGPFDQYAIEFKKWADCAKKESPPGKCVIICACTKTLLTKDGSCLDKALELVEISSMDTKDFVIGLAGMVFCYIGQKEKGICMLREALEISSSSVIALNLAVELDGDENLDEGVELCNSVLETEPNNIKALRILSVKYLNKGEGVKAKDAIMHALNLDTKSKLLREVYGNVFYHEEKYPDALREYKKARSFLGYRPYVDYRLAICYYKLGKLRKSRKFAKKINNDVFEIDPYFRDNSDEIKQRISEVITGN